MSFKYLLNLTAAVTYLLILSMFPVLLYKKQLQKYWSLVLLLILFSSNLRGQNRVSGFLIYENIPGLSNGKLSAVCQSPDGFLWIGSENGLIRFDGYRYQRIAEGQNSIADNNVTDVVTDSSGNVWIGGLTKGLSRYDIQTRTFKQYNNLWPANKINRIQVQADGKIWLATGGNGLAYYAAAADSFIFYKPNTANQTATTNLIDANDIIDLAADKQDPRIIWLVTKRHVLSFNTQTLAFTQLPIETAPGYTFSCIEYDNRSGLWLGTISGGTFYYNLKTAALEKHAFLLNQQEVKGIHFADVAVINDSTLWWACEEFGLLEYDTRKGSFSFAGPAFRYDSTQKSNYAFYRIIPGANAGTFVTMAGGYLQSHPSYKRLSKLLPGGVPQRSIQVSGVVFDSTRKEYIVATQKSTSLQVLSASLKSSGQYVLPLKNDSSNIVTLAINQQNKIIALTASGALYTIPSKGSVLTLAGNIACKGTARYITAGKTDNWWIVAANRLYKWNMQNSTDSFLFDAGFVKEPFINTVNTDSKGQVWLGTDEGLFTADNTAKRIVFKKLPGSINKPAGKFSIKNMVIDSSDNIWLSSDDGNLYCYNSLTNELTLPLKDKGFPDAVIHSLALLPNNEMLIAMSEGLCLLNTNTLLWRIFDKQDGLYQNNITNGIFTSKDGVVIANNFYQYNIFHYTEMPVQQQQLKINIIRISVNDVELPGLQLNAHPLLIELPYTKNTIQVMFAAMHWVYPKQTRYQYRLLHGNDNAVWQYLNEPLVQLTALSPGKYVLELKAIAGDSSTTVKININIKAPVWQRLWFIGLCFLAVVGIVVLLYQFRIRQIRKTNEVRSIISRNLHDEIGSTLTSISILSNVSQQAMETDPEQAKEMIRKISVQSKGIQQSISDIVWAIRSDNDKIENLLVRIREYAAQTLEPLNIHTNISIDEQLLNKALSMQARKELLLIYKEAVNNIAKHSGAAEATIILQQAGSVLQLTISDNGKWKGSGKTSGTGIGSMQQRAVAIGGECKIDISDKGTIITILIPVT